MKPATTTEESREQGRAALTVSRYGRTRFWAVTDPAGELVCVCVYKKGAQAVASHLGDGQRFGARQVDR